MDSDTGIPPNVDISNGDSLVMQTELQMVPSITISGPQSICPDLLRLNQLGSADGWRGHVVRSFFRLLKLVTGV